MDKQNNELMALLKSVNEQLGGFGARLDALESKKEEPKKEVETKILLPEEVIASKLESKKAKVEKDVIKNDGKIEMREAEKFGKISVMTLRNKSSLINYVHHITAMGKLKSGTVKIQYKGSIGTDGLLKENSKVVQKGEPLSYDDIAKAWNFFHLATNSITLYNYHTSDIVMMLSVIK